MSSCDGVSPIVHRAGEVLPEGVTYTPRQGSSQPQQLRAPAREVVWLRSQLNQNFLTKLHWCFIVYCLSRIRFFFTGHWNLGTLEPRVSVYLSRSTPTVASLGVPVDSSVIGSAPICPPNISTTSGQRKETTQKPGAKTRRAKQPRGGQERRKEYGKTEPREQRRRRKKPAQEHDRTRPGEQHQKKKKPAQQARTGREPDTQTVSLFVFGCSGSWVGALTFFARFWGRRPFLS